MSVEIKGLEKLLNQLEKRFGREHMQRVSDEALKGGAEVFVKELKIQFETFKDTGASIEEMTVSEPFWQGGVRTVKVYWHGPEQRYRVIHLNEWGTVINPNPDGKGAIARAMRNSERAYHDVIGDAFKGGL